MATCRHAIRHSARFLHLSSSAAHFAARKPPSATPCPQNVISICHGRSLTAPWQQTRSFLASARQPIIGQDAPSAQAYISSGVLQGSKNLVDVKKVIVIGSGGLSIGQAGEFDYSGMRSALFHKHHHPQHRLSQNKAVNRNGTC